MLNIKFKKSKLPFVYPFETAHGKKEFQEALLVAISYKEKMGVGEAPAIAYYPESMENMIDVLQKNAQTISTYSFNEPERFWHFLHHLLPQNPFLISALDMAYWDLYCQVKGQSLQEIIGIKKQNEVITDYTLGMDSYEKMLQKINENPWPIYKVKVKDSESILILEKLAEQTKSTFRIDANAAWSLEEALNYLPVLERLKIELIEQPLEKDDYEGHKKLKMASSIPIFADESFRNKNDLKKCAEAFDGINLKITKCGGLTPAIEICSLAKKNGLKLMMGCMNESEIGTYMSAQIAPLFDFIDLDGAKLLDNTLSKIKYEEGYLKW